MKKLILNYTFNASAKTLTLTDYTSLNKEGIFLITNVTDNIILYNFADNTYPISITDNIITLSYNTSSMSDSDDIQVLYDDGVTYELTNTELRATTLPVSDSSLLTELQSKTEPGDIQLTEVIASLQQILLGLFSPPNLDKSTNRSRQTAVIESGTITTVTTCTTVTGLTNIDGYQGKIIPINLSNATWAQVVRSRIS